MRPRAVAPWTWRCALRDHKPLSKNVRYTLFVIGTYMNGHGFCFPGQQLIAEGIGGTLKTVQRHIAEAERAGWISVEYGGRGGKGWRKHAYRACVPATLPLEELDESLADYVVADVGEVPASERHRGDKAVSSPSPHRGDKAVSSPSAGAHAENRRRREKRGDNGGANVATFQEKADDKTAPNVATSRCRTNSSENSQSENSRSEEAHDAQSRAASPRSAGMQARAYTRDELRQRVKVYRETGMQPDDIVRACLQGASEDDIRHALDEELRP